MSFAGLLVHDTYIVTAVESEDDYGNVVPDWGPVAARVAAKAWITQLGTSEDRNDRQTPTAQWIAFYAAGTAVSFTNRIEWGDRAFEVDGLPLEAWTPRGEHHIEVPLRFTGATLTSAILTEASAPLLVESGEYLVQEA